MNDKKIIYTLIAGVFHGIIPLILGFLIGNIITGLITFDFEIIYWIFWITLYGYSIKLFSKSFHETKPDIWSLAFAFGDFICILKEGPSYVPFGFWKGAVQQYSKAAFAVENTIHVTKLLKSEESSSETTVNEKFGDFKIGKVFEYMMDITFRGPLEIINPVSFFKKTGLKSFKEGTKLDTEVHDFYKIILADINSDIDTVAALTGYEKFKEKTDWTVDDLENAVKTESQNEQESKILSEHLQDFGLKLGKLATYAHLEKKTQEELNEYLKVQARRQTQIYQTETDKRKKIISAEAESKSIEIIAQGKAQAEITAVGAEKEVAEERRKIIKDLSNEIASLPAYKDMSSETIKDMVEATMNLYDSENKNHNIHDVRGLESLVAAIREHFMKK